MPFRYPADSLERRHGPKGYRNYESYRPWLRDEFSFRCVYCLLREQWSRAKGTFALDHFLPTRDNPDGVLDYDNLVYCCASCNATKSSQHAPDPCRYLVADEVHIHDDGRIEARSNEAQRIIDVLRLDSDENTEFRYSWIGIVAIARRYDPELYRRVMGYPADLPDLSRLRPPGGNSRPEGVEQSCYARRERGELGEAY